MTTEKRIQALLNANNTQLAEVDRVLSGSTKEERLDRICRRAEVAKLLGRSVRAVDCLREQKILVPVTMPGRARGAGFRLSDVQALIEKKAAA
jgi:hypothetical protein